MNPHAAKPLALQARIKKKTKGKKKLSLACIGVSKWSGVPLVFFSVAMIHNFRQLLLESFLPIMQEKTVMP